MKIRKKIYVVLALVLCLGSSMNAMAAGLTDAEESILAKLRAGVEVNGDTIQVPVSYINQAENELTNNETDVTAEQAATIITKIDAVAAIAKEEGITSAADLKDSGSVNEIVALVKEAAAVVDYTVAYDAANGTVSVTDPDGNTVVTTKNVVNQTGFDMTATLIVGGVLVTLLAACVVIASKKKLFVKSMEA